MSNEHIVGAICASCSSCFKNNCPRGSWSSLEPLLIPRVGTDDVCMLASMPAKKPAGRPRDISVRDTWRVCSSCGYCSNGKICVDDFAVHCIDCQCAILRESLEEIAAEAAVS